MQNLKNTDLSKIAGGTGCFCIHIYNLTLIPMPLKTITTHKACKENCCVIDSVFDDSRFKFNGTLFNCYEDQEVLDLADFHPPQDELAKLLIEEAKIDGHMMDNFNELASLIFD